MPKCTQKCQQKNIWGAWEANYVSIFQPMKFLRGEINICQFHRFQGNVDKHVGQEVSIAPFETSFEMFETSV